MKRSTITLAVLIAMICSGITCAFAANYTKFSSKFVRNFKDCDSYQEVVDSEFEGQEFHTVRKIIGWKNGSCKYQEVVSSKNDKYQLDCSFPDLQLNEIYDSMKDRSKNIEKHELELYTEQKDAKNPASRYKVAGTTTIKGNRAYITWAKYQNNPYFCRIQKLNR